MKTIKQIINGRPINVGSIKVQEVLPNNGNFVDPFLVFHHGIAIAEKDVPVHLQGVGPHPHRGFSAVSFIYKGGVHHQDSRGNNHEVFAGGTQWTSAGRGIIHSERPPATIHELGGEQELLQVWVNTPAKYKMDEPKYYPATAAETPTIETKDGLTTLQIVTGEIDGVKGIIPTYSPVNTIMGTVKKGGSYVFTIPTAHNSFLYVLNGKIFVNNKEVVYTKQMVLFENDATQIAILAKEDSYFFVGSGEPLNEPIASHGPFVMTTQATPAYEQ
jgi:quercetin 2,3-dioxygenase